MGIHEGKTRSWGAHKTEEHTEQNTGLTLPPPAKRGVHVPHHIYRGGVLWRPLRTGRYPIRDPWLIRQIRALRADRAVQGAMVEQVTQEAMAEQGAQEAMAASLRGLGLILRPGLYGRSFITKIIPMLLHKGEISAG